MCRNNPGKFYPNIFCVNFSLQIHSQQPVQSTAVSAQKPGALPLCRQRLQLSGAFPLLLLFKFLQLKRVYMFILQIGSAIGYFNTMLLALFSRGLMQLPKRARAYACKLPPPPSQAQGCSEVIFSHVFVFSRRDSRTNLTWNDITTCIRSATIPCCTALCGLRRATSAERISTGRAFTTARARTTTVCTWVYVCLRAWKKGKSKEKLVKWIN